MYIILAVYVFFTKPSSNFKNSDIRDAYNISGLCFVCYYLQKHVFIHTCFNGQQGCISIS